LNIFPTTQTNSHETLACQTRELVEIRATTPYRTPKAVTDKQSRIKNPLAGVPRGALFREVDAFAEEKGLTKHSALLRKGALVAQDPGNYEDLDGEYALSTLEIEDLRGEVLNKWRQPTALYFTIITCSIGAAV
jgi:hypothetical protein